MAVDDDALRDPAHPPRGVDAILETLRTAGVPARHLDAPADVIGGTLLVALFGDAREGYSDAARDLVADLWADSVVRGRQITVLQFGHPRRADEIPEPAPVVCAWSGDRAMQQAAARWVSALAHRARG